MPEDAITDEDRRWDNVGNLCMSLYGTRDAAMNWQEEVAREMQKWEFRRGRYNPCLYWNEGLQLMALVHGDDFVTAGSLTAAAKFKGLLQSRFEIKTQVVGSPTPSLRTRPGDGGELQVVPEGRGLNRVIRRGDER